MGGGNHAAAQTWVIVETAREALAQAADFLDDGQREVIFKDLLGNLLTVLW